MDVAGNVEPKRRLLPQYLAVIAANLLGLNGGCTQGWSSPVLDSFLQKGSITAEQASWVASLMAVGMVVGTLLGGLIVGRIGRLRTLQFVCVPSALAWVLLALGPETGFLYSGRVLQGIVAGVGFCVVPGYVAEVAEDKVRGGLGSIMNLLIVSGLLLVTIVAPRVPFVPVTASLAVIPIVNLALLCLVPESPYYLLAQGRDEDAAKALRWLRGCDADDELTAIRAVIEQDTPRGSVMELLRHRRALVICLGLLFLQQLAGNAAVTSYMQPIMRGAGGDLNAEDSSAIGVGVMLAASFVAPTTADRFGRRPLLLISAVGMALSLGVLGTCFYLQETDVDTSSFGWLPAVALVVYLAVFSIGFGPLPWAYAGELFPPSVKGLAGSVSACSMGIAAFLTAKFFNQLVEVFRQSGAIWFFAAWCVFAAVFVILLVPETKGKSMVEMQMGLDRKCC